MDLYLLLNPGLFLVEFACQRWRQVGQHIFPISLRHRTLRMQEKLTHVDLHVLVGV